MTFACPIRVGIRTCGQPIPAKMVCCQRHWLALPRETRDQLAADYREFLADLISEPELLSRRERHLLSFTGTLSPPVLRTHRCRCGFEGPMPEGILTPLTPALRFTPKNHQKFVIVGGQARPEREDDPPTLARLVPHSCPLKFQMAG
jgi:hypothetical protein